MILDIYLIPTWVKHLEGPVLATRGLKILTFQYFIEGRLCPVGTCTRSQIFFPPKRHTLNPFFINLSRSTCHTIPPPPLTSSHHVLLPKKLDKERLQYLSHSSNHLATNPLILQPLRQLPFPNSPPFAHAQ